MVSYNYHLSRQVRKYICPQCGKKTFTPYCDKNDNIVNLAIYGRCDRENNCGYIKYPHGLQKPKNEPKNDPKKALEPMRLNVIPQIDLESNLFRWALTLIPLPDAIKAWQRYKVGKAGQFVIFWQINEKGEVHAGKLIPYSDDGHRRKDNGTPPTMWVHKVPKYKPFIMGEDLDQCFFGQHLLTPDVKEVCIVESEKTAIMMSVFDARGRTYLATGGSGNLNNLCEKAVKRGLFLHKKVILIPDNGQIKNWQKTALKYGFIMNDICDNCSEVGCDILDLNEWIRKEPKKILNDEKIKRFVDNLNK